MSGYANAAPILYLMAIRSHHDLRYSGFIYLPPRLYNPTFREQSASESIA